MSRQSKKVLEEKLLMLRFTCLFAVLFSFSVMAQEGTVIVPKAPIPDEETKAVEEVPAKPASFLYSNLEEFPVMMDRLMKKPGYRPGLGHSTAVAVLVNCLSGVAADKKIDFLNDVILNLDTGSQNNFRRRMVLNEIAQLGDIRLSGQAARLAAILTCKIGERTFDQMISDFDGAIAELDTKMSKITGKGTAPFFYNLITAAALMN